MIEIEIKDTITLSEKELCEFGKLTKDSTDEEIATGVNDYLNWLGGGTYPPYLLKYLSNIIIKIKKYLRN